MQCEYMMCLLVETHITITSPKIILIMTASLFNYLLIFILCINNASKKIITMFFCTLYKCGSGKW